MRVVLNYTHISHGVELHLVKYCKEWKKRERYTWLPNNACLCTCYHIWQCHIRFSAAPHLPLAICTSSPEVQTHTAHSTHTHSIFSLSLFTQGLYTCNPILVKKKKNPLLSSVLVSMLVVFGVCVCVICSLLTFCSLAPSLFMSLWQHLLPNLLV